MTDVASPLPALAVAVPAVAVPLLYLARDHPTVREGVTAVAALGLLGTVGLLTDRVLAGEVPVAETAPVVLDAGLALRADAFGTLFALLAATLWVVSSLYSAGYVRSLELPRQTRYFAAFAASLAATVGVALAANLVTLFVCYELLTVATYPLVVHDGGERARRAGRTYLAYTLTGGVLVLGGTVLVVVLAGTTTLSAGGIAGLATADPALARLAVGLLVVGFAVKTAVMPLHGWLPAAMVAPAPVSGLLHAVAVVKSGAFALGRTILYVAGPEELAALGVGAPLAVAAGATTLVAGVAALHQVELKRALAYSTVSQLAYIALGFAIATPLAVLGAVLHVLAHATMKITLFLTAGTIYVETGLTRLDELDGVARRLPGTVAAFVVTAVGLAGLPPVAGFVSKWYLVLGSLEAGAGWAAAVYLLAGTLKLALFWPIFSRAALGRGAVATGDGTTRAADGGLERRRPWTETRPALLVPVLVTAGLALVLGLAPDALPTWDLAQRTVTGVFGG